MFFQALNGILIPFLGTTPGAGCVFFMRRSPSDAIQRCLNGFAGGVMVAASVWSLLIPAMNECEDYGSFAFVPAVIGFFVGIFFLLFLDKAIPHTHINEQSEGPRSHLGKRAMLFLAITLHNIPEGVAVGVVFASFMAGSVDISLSEAFALSIGIGIQNFPEGAIVSMPLASEGSRARGFLRSSLFYAVSFYCQSFLIFYRLRQER